jgi:hypothetical protein
MKNQYHHRRSGQQRKQQRQFVRGAKSVHEMNESPRTYNLP